MVATDAPTSCCGHTRDHAPQLRPAKLSLVATPLVALCLYCTTLGRRREKEQYETSIDLPLSGLFSVAVIAPRAFHALNA